LLHAGNWRDYTVIILCGNPGGKILPVQHRNILFMMAIALFIYTCIVLSFIWARIWFFNVNSGTHRLFAFFYDVSVAIQMISTLIFMLTGDGKSWPHMAAIIFLYIMALSLFWWSLLTAKSLDFAFSEKVGNIVTSGPFGVVRHPFYSSYIIVWLSSALLFNSPILWITLLLLTSFYFVSARKEERVIMRSGYSEEYGKYIQNVGMFLPRMKNGSAKIQDFDEG
jgi:protein-S-isoprenylcysteine O-methyltransferase Ste14